MSFASLQGRVNKFLEWPLTFMQVFVGEEIYFLEVGSTDKEKHTGI